MVTGRKHLTFNPQPETRSGFAQMLRYLAVQIGLLEAGKKRKRQVLYKVCLNTNCWNTYRNCEPP